MSRAKTIVITSLENNENLIRSIGQEIADKGLNVIATAWQDTSDSIGLTIKELLQADAALWIIFGDNKTFENSQTRASISLIYLAVLHQRDNKIFPVLFSPNQDEQSFTPPNIFCNSENFAEIKNATTILKNKIATKAFILASKNHNEKFLQQAENNYRLNVICPTGLGLWLEVGTTQHNWQGVLLGSCGNDTEPVAHGVGVKDILPQRSTLNYQVKGMQLEISEQKKFIAWGCQNLLTPDVSYFVKLNNIPTDIIFSEFPREGEEFPEMFVINLV